MCKPVGGEFSLNLLVVLKNRWIVGVVTECLKSFAIQLVALGLLSVCLLKFFRCKFSHIETVKRRSNILAKGEFNGGTPDLYCNYRSWLRATIKRVIGSVLTLANNFVKLDDIGREVRKNRQLKVFDAVERARLVTFD